MVKRKVKIVNRAGLHTRPAAMLVKIASKYKSQFFISKDDYRINGKSIIGVMTLAAAQGTELDLDFDGADEHTMADEICVFFERGFEET
ncbi:MAG: HPr family phosphocarrier protein [Ignavibacteriales bacterium]|nr:MAG: HPr family phosphocarrier protein [Ignavibacteriaceae bacterium]MBW7872877.1 HPr family phosphocarrier protein [Ignavibacteria bacterium]MCZ2142494.1 HPr family phosphocarrier protein [Ignavibacteriales bacterium]OQY71346.1 MAG: phosphocarrier protein HPr [Ignavibacteriales bacterium UTCHB3]MBV6445375.1 HPr-like protein Crh [Ignavibacteriaceae bacterium]